MPAKRSATDGGHGRCGKSRSGNLKIRALADQQGVSEAALLNLLLKERIDQLEAVQEK